MVGREFHDRLRRDGPADERVLKTLGDFRPTHGFHNLTI